VGAIALSILALFGFFPAEFASIAAIAIGVSLLFEGAAVTNRMLKYLDAVSMHRIEIVDLKAGASIESLAGISGVTLGILALLGVGPAALLPITAIVFGGALILGGGVSNNLNNQLLRMSEQPEEFKIMAGRMMATTSDLQLLLGVGVVVLGILSLLGINAALLTLVAFITVGASDVLKSSSIGGRLARVLHRG
jgi:hypothetical protein